MQLMDIREYALDRGFDIVGEFVDNGISGSIQQRPALDKLMQDDPKKKFNIVLVWSSFARSSKYLNEQVGKGHHQGTYKIRFKERKEFFEKISGIK